MNHQAPRSSLLLAACAAAVLAACGGGSNSSPSTPVAAVPAPVLLGQSTVSGTVTGFGSVIIDGVRVDDSKVAAGKERDDGTVEQVELKLGQHVEVEHDGQLVATKVRVSAEAEGSVAAVDVAAGTLTVVGQAVSVNADPAAGPVTVFAGYTALADVQVNDKVEVHGLIKVDAAGKSSLQATRIEKKTAADSADRVNGVVAELSASAHTFKLGSLLVDYSGATLLPDGAALANGAQVHVVVPSGSAAGAAVKATVVKVRDHKGERDAKDSELGGAVAALDAAAKTFTVNGVKVDASAASFDQAGKTFADLKAGAYVVVKGSYGADGTLKAATIVLRGARLEHDGQVELHGSVANFVSLASFTVRDVKVDASGVTLDLASCGNAQLGNALQVEVKGVLDANGQVKATAISCEKAGDLHAVLTREGAAGSVDTAARTFTLATANETIKVQWSDLTLFRNVDAASLSGKKVEVIGLSAGGVLQAAKIALAD